jgi:hypothetical protein
MALAGISPRKIWPPELIIGKLPSEQPSTVTSSDVALYQVV